MFQDGVLPCTLRSHKSNLSASARSGSSGPNDSTSEQHTSGPVSERTISSNAHDPTLIPHHHHPHAAASGDPSHSHDPGSPGSLHSYVPFLPPPSHNFAVKQGIPGPVDRHLKSVLINEMLKEFGSLPPPPTFPAAPLSQQFSLGVPAKPVPGIALDEYAKALAINELLKELFGSTPVVFEPLPVPWSPVPAPPPSSGPPTETLPAAVPYSKLDSDQALQLKQLISILFPMPGSTANVAAPSPAADYVPSAAPPNTIPTEMPSTVLPETGPAAGVLSTFSAPAPVNVPNTVVAAPVPVADSAPVVPTSANPAPPPETIAAAAATAPVQNDNAQVKPVTPDVVSATTVLVPVNPPSP